MAYDYFETVKEDAIRYLTAHPMKYEDYEDDPLNVVEYLMYESEVTHYSEEYTEETKKCIIDNFPLLVETYTYGKGTSSLIEDFLFISLIIFSPASTVSSNPLISCSYLANNSSYLLSLGSGRYWSLYTFRDSR